MFTSYKSSEVPYKGEEVSIDSSISINNKLIADLHVFSTSRLLSNLQPICKLTTENSLWNSSDFIWCWCCQEIFFYANLNLTLNLIWTTYYLLSKSESVKIYWLSVKFERFKLLKRGYCESVKFHWLLQWKETDLTVENIILTEWSVKINWF